MTRKTPLTAEEHADLGAVLAAIRDELLHHSVRLASAYPKTAPQVTHLNKALAAVDSARCALDNALCREHPDTFDTHTYYPGEDNRPRLAVRRDEAPAQDDEAAGCAGKHVYTITDQDGKTHARTEGGPHIAWVLWQNGRPRTRDITAAHLDGAACPVETRNVRALMRDDAGGAS